MNNSRREFLKKLGIGVGAAATTVAVPSIITDVLDEQDKEIKMRLQDPNGNTLTTGISNKQRELKEWQLLYEKVEKDIITLHVEDYLPKQFYIDLACNIEKVDRYQVQGQSHLYYDVIKRNIPLAMCYYNLGIEKKMFEALERGMGSPVSSNVKSKVMIESGDYLAELGYNKKALKFYKVAKALNKNASVMRRIKNLAS